MIKLVLVRHGKSTWNKENRFTGWTDVPLAQEGIVEAKEAGMILKDKKYQFDVAYTSVLKRAVDTLAYILEELDERDIRIIKDYRLNERHYGALQGLNKEETAMKYGQNQVALWRRSIDTYPPALTYNDKRYPGFDSKYQSIPKEKLPLTENLRDTIKRVEEVFEERIKPDLLNGKKVIIVAHGNSLRALISYLDNLSPEETTTLEVPTGKPICYCFSDDLQVLEHYYI